MIKEEQSGSQSGNIPEEFRRSTYFYDLPRELIAQTPSTIRDRSRLLVLKRSTGNILHHVFEDLPRLLRPSDVIVVNQTKVIPALLRCRKETGGRVELLVVDPADEKEDGDAPAERICLAKSSKRIRPGTRLIAESGTELLCEEIAAPGRVRVRFPVSESHFLNFLDQHGTTPLPTYIGSVNRDRDMDRERYQTVFGSMSGSVAAPTAGLHFTDKLIKALEEIGVTITRILLHVGPGTFLPVRTEDVRLHGIEPEYFDISQSAADCISRAKKENRRVIGVGTTTTRALETAGSRDGEISALKGRTDLFIKPGYQFKIINGIITNFHLPESTLLMLVCALGGTARVMAAYMAAVDQRYRFYSYGDASLIID